jgi:hypothetical protein
VPIPSTLVDDAVDGPSEDAVRKIEEAMAKLFSL